jgi:hypothetical protein
MWVAQAQAKNKPHRDTESQDTRPRVEPVDEQSEQAPTEKQQEKGQGEEWDREQQEQQKQEQQKQEQQKQQQQQQPNHNQYKAPRQQSKSQDFTAVHVPGSAHDLNGKPSGALRLTSASKKTEPGPKPVPKPVAMPAPMPAPKPAPASVPRAKSANVAHTPAPRSSARAAPAARPSAGPSALSSFRAAPGNKWGPPALSREAVASRPTVHELAGRFDGRTRSVSSSNPRLRTNSGHALRGRVPSGPPPAKPKPTPEGL